MEYSVDTASKEKQLRTFGNNSRLHRVQMTGGSLKGVEGSNINHFPRGNKKHQEEATLG
jgi:hypothetical protein